MRARLAAVLDAPLLRTRAMRQLAMANAMVGLSSSIALPFLPLYLTMRVGASATEIGLLLTMSGASGVLVSAVLGPLSDHVLPRKPLIAVGSLSGASAFVVFALSRDYDVVLAVRVMLVSWLFGALYFGTLALATTTWQLAAAQTLSTVYISGLYGVGITYFQELIGRPGSASTLFFNGITAGSTVAGLLWGLVVATHGYRGALVTCVLLSAASVALLAAGHLLRTRSPVTGPA